MDRRTLLKGVAGAGTLANDGKLVRPCARARALRRARCASCRKPTSRISTRSGARNTWCAMPSAMVWDTLYGVDDKLEPQRQMVGIRGSLGRRPDLDVPAAAGTEIPRRRAGAGKDVVASLDRWAARDHMGQMLKAIQQELIAVDDRTFKWVLKKPYPKMLLALGKNQHADGLHHAGAHRQDRSVQADHEYVGSGPMRFVQGRMGARAPRRCSRNSPITCRAQEPASWLAGGKRMLVDRIEWVVMPDPGDRLGGTAERRGRLVGEPASPTWCRCCERTATSRSISPTRWATSARFRMNHLYPPFNDVRARRAVLMAMSQEDYMRAMVGDDDMLWKPLPGFFTPGTPLYTEEGGEILKGRAISMRAKKLLAESGYTGQPVTCLVAQDLPITKAQGDVTADLLKRLGMNVDFAAIDWGTVGARRAQKTPPGQGGWQMFHTWHAGADCINPAVYIAIRANGDKAWFGWPDVPEVEARDHGVVRGARRSTRRRRRSRG